MRSAHNQNSNSDDYHRIADTAARHARRHDGVKHELASLLGSNF